MTPLLTPNNVQLGLTATSMAAVIDQLVRHEQTEAVSAPDEAIAAVLAREADVPTGFVQGIAIPHAKTAAVQHPAIVIGRLAQPVAWTTLDGSAVDTVIMILTPAAVADTHLKLLAMIAGQLADEAVITALKAAQTPAEIIQVLEEDE
ncbi:PTS sugar transporter subunit IIA [Lacticaseibacillus daqingensis]|uniref:PTS sugar transporter subunit IIA n=1 Tax=Lacticaseibacillus daqingensis TaxID=2486014 RepID=UPI000F7994D4|nr:PTS sugar transporter subunit IIA [Lacticaseibacillus daqingensis]